MVRKMNKAKMNLLILALELSNAPSREENPNDEHLPRPKGLATVSIPSPHSKTFSCPVSLDPSNMPFGKNTKTGRSSAGGQFRNRSESICHRPQIAEASFIIIVCN